MKRCLASITMLPICCTTFLCPKSTYGQELIFIFAHAQYANPLDDYFSRNYSHGFGFEVGAGIGMNRTFLMGTAGYSSFSASSSNAYGQLTYIPLKIGIRHYLLVGKILFIQADGGVGHVQNELVNASRFTGDIGLGVKLGPFEVIADYDGFARSDAETSGYSSWLGIKAGIRFGL
ncbi:MAG: hypothetical protein ACHQET_09070 [Chitinophagales bacterium]